MIKLDLEPDELEDWKNEINEATQWLSNLQKDIDKPEFSKLHENIKRINRIKGNLNRIFTWLNNFTTNENKSAQ